jgi:hypothetical protein
MSRARKGNSTLDIPSHAPIPTPPMTQWANLSRRVKPKRKKAEYNKADIDI